MIINELYWCSYLCSLYSFCNLHKPLLSNVDFYASLRPFLIIKKILHLPRRLNNVRSHRLRRKLFISNDSFHKVTQMTGACGWLRSQRYVWCELRWPDLTDMMLYWVKQMANHIAQRWMQMVRLWHIKQMVPHGMDGGGRERERES